jgi:hypothetical protein
MGLARRKYLDDNFSREKMVETLVAVLAGLVK